MLFIFLHLECNFEKERCGYKVTSKAYSNVQWSYKFGIYQGNKLK